MTRIEVELSDDLKRRTEARAAQVGHANLREYIRFLVEEDTADGTDTGAPANLTFRSRSELEAFLMNRLNDGKESVEVTDVFWEELRSRLKKKHERQR